MDMAGRAYFILNIFTILLYNIKYRFDEIDRQEHWIRTNHHYIFNSDFLYII